MAEKVADAAVAPEQVVSAPAPVVDKQDQEPVPEDKTPKDDTVSDNKPSEVEPKAEPKQPVHISVLPKSNTEFSDNTAASSSSSSNGGAPAGYTPLKKSNRQRTAFALDNYFAGPRDISKHSKWPLFLQMHGSILPRLIVPLFFLGGWATAITCISKFTSVNRRYPHQSPLDRCAPTNVDSRHK